MKKRSNNIHHFILIVLLISFSIFSTAEATTQIDFAEAFNIKAINGSSYSSGMVNQNRTIKLRAGLNLIALEFEEVYESEDDDNFDIVKSNVFLLKVYLQKDTQYRQRFTKPHDASAAKRYILNPIFEIINNNIKESESTRFELSPMASNEQSYVIAQTKLRPNAMLDLSYPTAKLKTNTINSSLANTNTIFKPKTKSNKMHSTQNLKSTRIQSNASKMLNYWWQQATPDERAAFLSAVSAK